MLCPDPGEAARNAAGASFSVNCRRVDAPVGARPRLRPPACWVAAGRSPARTHSLRLAAARGLRVSSGQQSRTAAPERNKVGGGGHLLRRGAARETGVLRRERDADPPRCEGRRSLRSGLTSCRPESKRRACRRRRPARCWALRSRWSTSFRARTSNGRTQSCKKSWRRSCTEARPRAVLVERARLDYSITR